MYTYSYHYEKDFGPGFYIFVLLISIFYIFCLWKIFEKAGKPGWAAIVPIYNYVVMLQIVKLPVWLIILLLIPFVNAVVAIVILYNLAKAFGKDIGFFFGLFFLSFIFIPILAFGDAKYAYAGQTGSDDLIDDI